MRTLGLAFHFFCLPEPLSGFLLLLVKPRHLGQIEQRPILNQLLTSLITLDASSPLCQVVIHPLKKHGHPTISQTHPHNNLRPASPALSPSPPLHLPLRYHHHPLAGHIHCPPQRPESVPNHFRPSPPGLGL